MSPLDNFAANIGTVVGLLAVAIFYAAIHACVYGVAYAIGYGSGLPTLFVFAVLWAASWFTALVPGVDESAPVADKLATWIWAVSTIILRLWAVFYILRLLISATGIEVDGV